MAEPSYEGSSRAIHVLQQSFGAEPIGPTEPLPAYLGKSPKMWATDSSPSLSPQDLTGPAYPQPMYKGMSKAIHVLDEGEPIPPPPPPPGDGGTVCLIYSCGVADPLLRTSFNYANVRSSNGDPDTDAHVEIDLRTPPGGALTEFNDVAVARQSVYTSLIAEYRIYLQADGKLGFARWTVGVGANPGLDPYAGVFGDMNFNESHFPVTVDWDNVEVSAIFTNICGYHPEFQETFFGAPLEYSQAFFRVGDTDVNVITQYGDQSGIFPFLGPQQPLRALIYTRNGSSGNIFLGEFEANLPIPIFISIHKDARDLLGVVVGPRVEVIANGVSHVFADPDGFDDDHGIQVGWDAKTYREETSAFEVRAVITSVTPCSVKNGVMIGPVCVPLEDLWDDPTIWGGDPNNTVTFRPQIGDPTTTLDRTVCLLESAAMVLDWHTQGAVKVWGGELVPWCGKSEDQIRATGTSLLNAKQAWAHFGAVLNIRAGETWDDLVGYLNQGRAVILGGEYIGLDSSRCDDFEGAHAIAVFPRLSVDGLSYLVGDPLCRNFKFMTITLLKEFARLMGVDFYGSNTPQPIYFAVSRPWVLVPPLATPPPVTGGGAVTFFDDFITFDTTRWAQRGYIVTDATETNSYDPANAFASGSVLTLRASKVGAFSWNVVLINTLTQFSQLYGLFEARIKIPKGLGLWPAWWLYPGSTSQELDIMEILANLIGNDNGGFGGDASNLHTTIHFGGGGQAGNTYSGPDLSLAYHTYAMEWRAAYISFLLDGVEVYRYTGANIPDQSMALFLNLVVGSSWGGPSDTSTPDPSDMLVDWVRVSV